MTAIAQSTLVNQAGVWIRCSDDAVEDGMTANISIVSTSDQFPQVRVDVAISVGEPTPATMIESYAAVVRGTPLLRTGEPFKQGEALFVRAEQLGIAVRLSGYNRL